MSFWVGHTLTHEHADTHTHTEIQAYTDGNDHTNGSPLSARNPPQIMMNHPCIKLFYTMLNSLLCALSLFLSALPLALSPGIGELITV